MTVYKKVGAGLEKLGRAALLLLIASYRTIGNTHLGGACRFHPSCSEYAIQAIENLPSWQASFLILKRILKCRPFGPRGFDPVPSKQVRTLNAITK